jgi:hypothetical protein
VAGSGVFHCGRSGGDDHCVSLWAAMIMVGDHSGSPLQHCASVLPCFRASDFVAFAAFRDSVLLRSFRAPPFDNLRTY